MSRKSWIGLWAALLWVSTSWVLGDRLEAEPKVASVLEQHRKAMGEGWAEVRSLKALGIYAYNGLDHPFVEYRASPNKLRRDIDGLQQYGNERKAGEMVVRARGEGGAWVQGQEGAKPMADNPTPAFTAEAWMGGLPFVASSQGFAVEWVGSPELEGVPTHHLGITVADGQVEQWWLDAETFRPIRRSVPPADDFLSPHTWHFDDWRQIGDLWWPFYVMAEEKVFSREYLYEKVELNPELDPKLFERPE